MESLKVKVVYIWGSIYIYIYIYIYILLSIKQKTEKNIKIRVFDSLSRRVDFSPLRNTRSNWIKAVQANFIPLQSCSTWQIYSSKNSFYIHAQFLFSSFSVLLSFLSLFYSPSLFCFLLKGRKIVLTPSIYMLLKSTILD